MEKDLKLYIEILNSERCLKKPKEAIVVLEKITKCFTQEKSQFTLGLLISLLLNQDEALFTFIWKMSLEYENVSAVSAAFKLLEYLLTKFQKTIEPYFPFLYRECLNLLNGKFAKVKEHSLKLIRNIIVADLRHSLDLPKLVLALEKIIGDDSKIPGTVLDQSYSLLGFLFKKYPESVKKEKWFFNKMYERLRQESTNAKNPSVSIIKGAFEGINGYLETYSPPDPETLKKIYVHIKNWSKFRDDRKAASRTALKVLQNHWAHFSDLIYYDREFWSVCLEVWIKQKREDRESAFKFLCAFYSVMALFIKQKTDHSEVQRYLEEFTNTLESSSNSFEKKAALAGIKLFVLTDALDGSEFNKTFKLLVSFLKKQESRRNTFCLPLGIECVSAFVLKSLKNNFYLEQLAFLQRLSVKLIDNYPNFENDLQSDALVALEKSFYMLGLNHLQILENHIDKVLYQGLMRTSSLMTLSELELLKEAGGTPKCFSYKSYLSLWKYLLNLAGTSNLPVGGSFALKKGVAGKVFDVFFRSFLKILSKLDFTVSSEFDVDKPSDIHIFINLVDLYQDLIPLIDPFNLQKWLTEILKTVIHLSGVNPLVSGFYKLAATSLKAADSIQLFDELTGEKEKCFELVRTFLEEILLKVDYFKGDLQVACLSVILKVPVCVVKDFVEKTIPALEVTTHLARSSSVLLKDLIETLERWDSFLPSATSSAILEKVLPHLDVFLQSPYFRGNNSGDRSKASRAIKNQLVFNDSEFLSLQKKLLLFLGSLETNKGMNLIEMSDAQPRRNISDKQLVYTLPCCNELVELNLEEIIPRVIDLAESCGDRKTRVIACELLHSIVILLLGNINQLSGGYSYMFKKVLKSCLLLGCDSDGLICQIFEPLMYQITHYLSGKQALNFSEADDLIDTLVENVTSPYNPTLRDFSALLLREFTVWSIKQLRPEELKVTPKSVKRILDKIYSLALHPSHSKRLGAAVLFNKQYSVLREEDFILKAYWFELFYYFMESLRMCDEPENVAEIIEAIHHVERPLVELYSEFNKESSSRIVPPEFKGRRLCHLVNWTMGLTCDPKPAVRRTAMALVSKLAPLVVNCDSNIIYVSKQLHTFFQLKVNSSQSNFGQEDFINWLKHQNAGFEYYIWLLEQKVLTTDEVFQSKLKTVIKEFIPGVLSQSESTKVINNIKQQCVLSFLKLLYALRERAYLYPSEHWDLLKTAVFKPSRLGFDLNREAITEQLLSILIDLLRYFRSNLTTYDWSKFYKSMEDVITAPVFRLIVRNQYVSVESSEFLFTLKVVEDSGLWETFIEKIFFSKKEDIFMIPIFNSLFFKRGTEIYAVGLEPSSKSYLEEVLKVIMKVSQSLIGVLNCSANEEEVLEEETGKAIKKGDYFLFLFKNIFFNFLERKHDLFLDWVLKQEGVKGVKLLIQVLENSSQDSDLAKKVFHQWDSFEKLNIKDSTQKHKLLLYLAVYGARVVGTPGFLKKSPVADKIYTMLETRKLEEMDVFEVEALISLLPFLSDFAENLHENDRLSSWLSKIQIDLDALKSDETFDASQVHLALTGILQSMKTTASMIVLNFALSRVELFNTICQKEDVESVLSVFGEDRVPFSHSLSALELTYWFCFECEKPNFLPSIVYKLFLSPLIKAVPESVAFEFLTERLESLNNLITTYWGDEKNSIEILINISKKICAAGLIQTFITNTPQEKIEQMLPEKRQLIVTMVKSVFLLLKKPYPPAHLKDGYRKLMCAIYNMICCVLNARCTNEKFYQLFVFDQRGSFLFETIDKTAKYNLEMDFDEIPKRKKHLTILRKTIAAESQPNFNQNSINYIQTNTLFTSSLQEDVTRFDLSFSFVRPLDSVPQASVSQNEEIELEMDSLNSHDCMTTIIATITRMVRDGLTPVDDAVKLPSWLNFFMGVLKSDYNNNLKLFILKVIYNVQTFVAPFCEKIFSDLVDSILKVFFNYPINYFLIDLIEMMIEWRYIPQENRSQVKLTELVVLILEKSDSLRREIVKNNMEVIKTLIEIWKSGLYLPRLSFIVFKRLSESVEEDLKTNNNGDGVTYLNIHMTGILLSNGIPPWNRNSEKQFFNLILKSFRSENKHRELFGEICGLALSHIQKTDPDALPEYENLVRDKISSLAHSWLQLLYGVHKHYPKMSSQFTFRLFSTAWDSTDSLTVKKLEMLLSHVSGTEAAEDPSFDRHAFAFLMDMLNSPDFAIQEISLQIAEKILDKMDNDELKNFILEVVRLQRSASSDIRKWVYEICKKLYEKNVSDCVSKHCKVILLKGLRDGVEELEESCLKFWKSALNITSSTSALLLILNKMYASEAEDIFLGNAARVLLDFATDDCRSQTHLFPHPITHQCKFQKRKLVVGTRQSFLLSLASSGRTLTNQSLEHVATIRQRNLPYVRPTVSSLKFQPTMRDDVEKMTIAEVTTHKDTLMPTIPFKRRFCKNIENNYYSFVKWQKKKKLSEKEEEAKKREEEAIEIFGEYRDGDYPDIQIFHSQIMELLGALSKRDEQIARMFLVSFYSGVIKTVHVSRRKNFLLETRYGLENLLKSSENFNPGVFGFVLQVLLNHTKDLDIDCQLISNAAGSSNWISLGALIIEQIIANKEEDEEGVPEKRKVVESPEEKRWLELAKLYRSLEEFDVLSGIYLDKLHVEGVARKAICSEAVSDWYEASKLYEEVLQSDSDFVQQEFYTESYISCLAKLSNWSFLNSCIRTTVNNDLNKLWENFNLLSWFLRSEMMISLGSDERDFEIILEEFCKNSVRENILSTNFGEEMVVFDWFSKNLQKASYRIDKLCLDFLVEWSHLDQWSHNLRAAKLKKLQRVSELSSAVRNLAEVSKTQLEENIKGEVIKWEKSLPAPGDDLTIWDVKLGYRREFIKRLDDFDLRAVEVKSNHALAKAALSQGNLNLAKECLSRAKENLPEGDFDLKAEHCIYFNLGKIILAKMKMKDPNVGTEVYMNVWKGISKQIALAMETDSSANLTYSCNFALGRLVSDFLPYVMKKVLSSDSLNSLCSKLNSNETDVVNVLQNKALEYFETARNALELQDYSSETKSGTYLELSKFFFKFPSADRFEKLCRYLLRAMALGNPEARELFGCILNSQNPIPEEFPFNDIISETESVPSWMFLSWINQMLACLSFQMFPLLKSILLRVAKDYPNAIRYALKITEEIKHSNPRTKSFLLNLSGIVTKDKVYDNFWLSMKFLAPPDLILSHYLKDILQEVTLPNPNNSHITEILLYVQDIMFSPDKENFRGPIFDFWNKFKQPIENLLSFFDNQVVLKQKIKKILSSIENSKMPSRRTLALLESYSPWLYNFHSLKSDTTLEVPGQYDGSRRPIKKYLVTVSSFKNSVLVFDSKCRPMRIGILGNDAREHKFLVKFGEDLRQDERIQQVFRHFNHRLVESNQTSRFSVETYKVIPLTLSLGMIEWVEGHVSLYEMIESSLGNDSDAIGKAQSAHLSFLCQASPTTEPVAAHLIGFETIPREKAISNFRVRIQDFPRDLLKKSFLDLSTSPEHFVYLRRNFAISHAIMCMTHWLVGIGDRHLQNTLVSTKTGRVLGVDFGCAFGFATQLLTPPELLPFRLSPQILYLMHPIGESGWIKQTMIHCLRVFRKENFRLQSVLEVFAQEPVMDWLKQAKKKPTHQSENCEKWQPREKLKLVEKKLSGTNPVVIFEADLRAGHSGSKYLAKYLEVLKGDKDNNIRARCGEDGLSEEEEIECLIDLATDPHVLAKTYIGWNPWL